MTESDGAARSSDAGPPVCGPVDAVDRSGPFPLETLQAAFGLSRFERDVILLCAGPDLDSRFLSLLAKVAGDPRRTAPTLGLALALLPDAHWSALVPTAPLRRWRLVEVGAGDSLTSSPLRLDEWVLHRITGTPHLDERLSAMLRPVNALASAPAWHRARSEELARRWQRWPSAEPWPIVEFCGPSADEQMVVAAHAAGLLGAPLYRTTLAELPGSAAERESFARLWEREAALSGALLVLELAGTEGDEVARQGLAWLESWSAPVWLLTREPSAGLGRSRVRVDVPRLPPKEQRALWVECLGPGASLWNGELDRVAGHFNLSAREIQGLAGALRPSLAGQPRSGDPAEAAPLPEGPSLWRLCRVQTRTRLSALAQRIEAVASWEDLVLPAEPRAILRDIARHVRCQFRVHEEWGFLGKGARGLGISALFAGASGTGKTLAAEVLARELDLDLFRIDLSAVVSKYIGETEKNLRRVFEAAEAGGAILLFDEADALFGKRSEVKDSHDRYANLEISYLLQRMETYRGLAILTTNFKQALDPAFLRRLRFVVQFPFPDAAQRAEIWRRIFPAATPTDGLDVARLARLNVAGGNIRNIALNAAFLAADADEPVRMRHLLAAARTECAKLERPPSEAELGGWV